MKNYFVKNCDSQRVYICAFQRGQYLCIVCIFCVPQQKQNKMKIYFELNVSCSCYSSFLYLCPSTYGHECVEIEEKNGKP